MYPYRWSDDRIAQLLLTGHRQSMSMSFLVRRRHAAFYKKCQNVIHVPVRAAPSHKEYLLPVMVGFRCCTECAVEYPATYIC